MMTALTFIVPVGNEDVFQDCLLSSELFHLFWEESGHELIAQRGFHSAAEAFNDGMSRAKNDLIVCLHQDVILPRRWAERFVAEFEKLESGPEPVGVVGCAGITSKGAPAAHIYRHDREFYPDIPLPAMVETLDELLICFRKSSGLRFDTKQPSFFGYATDICLQAITQGRQNFVVDVPCFHQAKSREGRMPRQWFENWNYLCDKWKPYLPVQTLVGPLKRKRSYRVHNFVQFLREHVGHSPEPWWRRLPVIDPEKVMHSENLPAASSR